MSKWTPICFKSLPAELLARIADHLDRQSLLIFARISLPCSLTAEELIWKDLDLRWEGPRDTMGERMQTLMRKGSERRWGLVRSVKAILRSDTLHSLIQLLVNVSPNILSFEISASGDPEQHPAKSLDFFDIRLLSSGYEPNFLALRQIRLGKNTIRLLSFIGFLSDSALGLISLDIDIDNPPGTALVEDDLWYGGVSLGDHLRTLKRVRISYKGDGAEDLYEVSPLGYIQYMISANPHIVQASIRYSRYDTVPSEKEEEIDGMVAMADLETVEDLDWRLNWTLMTLSKCETYLEYAHLRRVLMTGHDWRIIVSATLY